MKLPSASQGHGSARATGAGGSFGAVTVIVDGGTCSFHEQAFDLVWSSPQLSPGDHFVRIIHESGESVNSDYIEILD